VAELTTLAALQEYLSITDSSYDAVLTNTLERAEDRIRRVCGKGDGLFASASRTEKIPGTGRPIIYLTHRPVTVITSVIAYADASTSSTLTSTTYRINDEQTGVMLTDWANPLWDMGGPEYRRTSALWRPYAREQTAYPYTQVIYTGGYATIPDDLAECALWLASQMYRERGVNYAVQSESLGHYSYTLANSANGNAITQELHERLAPFIVHM
jgi:hypothetical protein